MEFAVFKSDAFRYQAVADKVLELYRLGMSRAEIGKALGEEYKTIQRALKWSNKYT